MGPELQALIRFISKGSDNMKYVFDTTQTIRYRFPTHTNELVMDRAEAVTSEVFITVLEPGEAPPLHQHDDTEQVFYILQGRGMLEVGSPLCSYAVVPGNLVRIPPSTPHRIHCEGNETLKYVTVDCFPGGRPTAEPTWDSHVQVVCQNQGWDIQKVRQHPAT
jgi:mannose-6-phosphate isomerase-like protein (cupin superfamily)